MKAENPWAASVVSNALNRLSRSLTARCRTLRHVKIRVLTLVARIAVVVAFGVAAIPAAGQNVDITAATTTGVRPYETYEGVREDINLGTGNLHLSIPLLTLPGRSGHDLVVNVTYDSRIWTVVSEQDNISGQFYYYWRSQPDAGFHLFFPVMTGRSIPLGSNGHCTSDFVFYMPDGKQYAFNTAVKILCNSVGGPVPISNIPVGDTQDASYARLQAINPMGPASFILTLKDGTKYYFDTSWVAVKEEDPNGNIITYTRDSNNNLNGWADNLGRTVTITPATATTPETIAYRDSSGTTQTVTIAGPTQSLTLPTFTNPVGASQPCASDNPYPCGYGAIGSITLPNGRTYNLQYNNYGEVTQITYPTGGYTTYDYATFNGGASGGATADYREVVAKHVCPQAGGSCSTLFTTTYAPSVAGSTYNSRTTVTDPLGNQTVVQFCASVNASTRETSRTIYQRASTVLRTITTAYSDTYSQSCADDSVPVTQTTTLDNGMVSQVQWSYDTYTNAVGQTVWIDNVVEKREYDYGALTTPARRTDYTWLKTNPVNGQDYTSTAIHILDRKASEVVYNGSGSLLAQTTYEYDNYTAGLTASGAVQHDSSYGTGYTTRGNLTATSRWRNTDGVWLTTRNQYDDAGNVLSTTDPLGHTTNFSYADSWGNTFCTPTGGNAAAYRTSTTNALAQTTRKTYNSCTGTVASATDSNNQSTTFSYDGMNRLIQVNYPDGGQTTFSYNETSLPLSLTATKKTTSLMSLVTTAVVDGIGNVTQTKLTSDPQGTVYTDTTYDALERKKTVSNPYRSTSDPTYGITTYNYDALGRVTQVTRPDGSTVLTTYSGPATQVSDEGNGTQRVQRISQTDGLGRLISVCEVSSSTLIGTSGTPAACGQSIAGTGFLATYQYDVLNNLTQVSQGGLNPRTFTYNSLSQLLSANNPESGTITYTYDNDGNLLSKTAPAPNQTGTATVTLSYCYDALHRQTSKAYTAQTCPMLSPAATFSYDVSSVDGLSMLYPVGRLVKAATSNTATVNSYDPMGRVKNQWQCTPQNCGSGYFALAYNYDLVGDIISSTNGAGVTFSDTYNASAQLTTMTSSLADSNHPGTLFSNALYNGPGLLTAGQLGNGISESRSYNSRLWLTSLTAGSMYSLSMTSYAPNGDILAANDSVNGNWTYSYDAFNRLIGSNQNNGQAVYSYVYDRFGNRWQQNGPHLSSLSFSGNNNRMDGYSYDAAGNLLSDGSHSYTYDAENRIAQVDGGSTAQYVYDAAGQRVRKVSAAGTVDYLYDLAGNPITELNTAGIWTRTEVYAGGRHLVTYNGGASGQTYFIHADWLGTERVRSTVAGASYETCTSLPFGDWLTCSSPDVSTRHFTGKERDSESGLDDFDARYYSSTMGRFTSPDWSDIPAPVPYADLTNPRTLNLYGYVKNNPLRDTDPTGHSGDDDIVDHILNFVVSAGVTFISDNLFGAGRPEPKSAEGQLGQAVGDFAAQQSGIAEAEAGVAGRGGALVLAIAGQEEAAPEVAVVSQAMILHGTATAAIATANLAKSATEPGSRPGQDFTPAGKREIDARDASKCQNCGRDVKSQQNKPGQPTPADQRQRHHIRPKSEGGSGTPENGKTLCPGCHKEEHMKLRQKKPNET